MTREQKYVLDMVRGGKNVFFTGGAGTGKSFLINKIIGVLPPEHTFITASTGLFILSGVGSDIRPLYIDQLSYVSTVDNLSKCC